MAQTPYLARQLLTYSVDVSIWSMTHFDRAFGGRIDAYKDKNIVVSCTFFGNTIPHVAARLTVMMHEVLEDLEQGTQQLPPDGDSDIQYYGPTST